MPIRPARPGISAPPPLSLPPSPFAWEQIVIQGVEAIENYCRRATLTHDDLTWGMELAAKVADLDAFKLLHERGGRIDYWSIVEAAENGKKDIIEYILENTKVFHETDAIVVAICTALDNNQVGIVDYLYEQGLMKMVELMPLASRLGTIDFLIYLCDLIHRRQVNIGGDEERRRLLDNCFKLSNDRRHNRTLEFLVSITEPDQQSDWLKFLLQSRRSALQVPFVTEARDDEAQSLLLDHSNLAKDHALPIDIPPRKVSWFLEQLSRKNSWQDLVGLNITLPNYETLEGSVSMTELIAFKRGRNTSKWMRSSLNERKDLLLASGIYVPVDLVNLITQFISCMPFDHSEL